MILIKICLTCSYICMSNKKIIISMIECSPQEIISQSIYNCYFKSQSYIRGDSSKSMPKNIKGKTPMRKMDKISLKKSPSLSKALSQQNIINVRPSLQEETAAVNPYMIQKVTNSTNTVRIIENKSNINVRLVNQQAQIAYLMPKSNHQSTYQLSKDCLIKTSQVIRVEPDKISRAETYYSTARTENKQNSNFYSKHFDELKVKQIGQKPVTLNAEKNSLISSQLPLDMLQPKIAQSIVDQSLREQDQFSQVISSYFTKKIKTKDEPKEN